MQSQHRWPSNVVPVMRGRLEECLPFVRFLQFVYEIKVANRERTAAGIWHKSADARLPSGQLMENRLIEIPAVAVLIRRTTGALEGLHNIFPTGKSHTLRDSEFLEFMVAGEDEDAIFHDVEGAFPHADSTRSALSSDLVYQTPVAIGRAFETWEGDGYDYVKFMSMWSDQIAALMDRYHRLRFEFAHPPGKKKKKFVAEIAEKIHRSLVLVGNTLRQEPQEQLIACLMGIESLVCLDGREELAERFAVRLALLGSTDPERRRDDYSHAKRLYGLRGYYVHQADRFKPELRSDDHLKFAIDSLLNVLNGISNWAIELLEADQPCDDAAFTEWFLNMLFPDVVDGQALAASESE